MPMVLEYRMSFTSNNTNIMVYKTICKKYTNDIFPTISGNVTTVQFAYLRTQDYMFNYLHGLSDNDIYPG